MAVNDDEAAINALENPVEEAQEEVAEVEAESGVDEAAEEKILGKFNSQDDLVRAYQELEKEFHASRSTPAEETVEEEYIDPYQNLYSATVSEEDSQAIANYIQQCVAPGGPGAREAIEWATKPEVQNQFGPQIGNMVYQYISNTLGQPMAAQNALWEIQFEQRQSAFTNQFEQSIAPLQAEANERLAAAVHADLVSALPDFDEYKDRIVELMGSQPQNVVDYLEAADPATLAQFTTQLYYIARGEAWQASLVEQPDEEVPEKPAKASRTKTATKSTASKPSAVSDEDAEFFREFGIDITS